MRITQRMKSGLKITFLLVALIAGRGLYAQNNSTYSQLIEEADLYLKVGDTGFARIDYTKAVKMNPGAEYPRLKLAEIDRKNASQHRIDSLFEQNLVSAEKYFRSGNYNLAQIEYQRSLELKPESEFIKGRLATIRGSVFKTDPTKPEISLANLRTETAKPENNSVGPKADLMIPESNIAKPVNTHALPKSNSVTSNTGTLDTATERLVTPPTPPSPLQTNLTQAEEFFNVKDYENAAQRYQAALTIKPGDKAIKTKLTTTHTLLDKQKKDLKAYSDIILAAEKAATLKNTVQAIAGYEQAALIKPGDADVQSKLIVLRDRLIVEQNQEKDFKDILATADKFLKDNNLPEAKKSYEMARSIRPQEKYPQEKLLEISHIDALAEADKTIKYREATVLGESLLTQEDYQGAFQAFTKASELRPAEEYPKQKVKELDVKIKAMDAQYKIAYNGYILDATKASQAKNWDIAMDNYLKALKAKTGDTLAGNQIVKIISYMDTKLIATLTPLSSSILEGKEVKLPFKAIESATRRNHYLVVRVKNSAAGTPRLYIGYGLDSQKNGAIIYRNFQKGGQFTDYVIRIANQDRWYRLDNNWISLTVEGGSLDIASLKLCADY